MKYIKKWTGTVLTAGIVFSLLAGTADAAKPAQSQDISPARAYVDVAAATLWTKPNETRPLDAPSLSNPVDLRKWTTSMTYQDKLWLVGPLETQALYGNKVTITDEQGDWVKVAVDGQPTPRLEAGYPGWMPKSQLVYNKKYAKEENKPFALIKSPTAWLYKEKSLKHQTLELSYNTRLPVHKISGSSVSVLTPEGKTRYINRKDVQVYLSEKSIPVPTGEDLVNEGKKFLGLPYLWAGTSGFGFDCSGFTHTLYKAAGITIPRDSGPQSKSGVPVAKEDLKKGDLLFFAYNSGKGSVHHVGMYAGDGMMIHSPNSSTTVRIDKIEGIYAQEYAGARRYLP
ncbi:C40 family peptidase [Fictibacillus terranigra]|uniref:C40 family peptidase n=1 Tax=Fictibacillus terranigra TaxID=3058424 RepID=A0ABT8E7R0_9BACL|nr:C40 family peptidase [Fictibacillus sp. CENA-BCM004]MDN4073925.1 C40 family peptidase [Fictibacillus sp. CENA-BCM004]